MIFHSLIFYNIFFSHTKSTMNQHIKNSILNHLTISPHKWSLEGYGGRILQLKNFVSFSTCIPYKIPSLLIAADFLDEILLQINREKKFKWMNLKLLALETWHYL